MKVKLEDILKEGAVLNTGKLDFNDPAVQKALLKHLKNQSITRTRKMLEIERHHQSLNRIINL